MTSSQFLDQCSERQREYIERAKRATESVSLERLNHETVNGEWSPATVFQHMIISHAAYLTKLEEEIPKLPLDSSNAGVKNTWFGATLAKQAGPGTNAPVPGRFRPPSGPQPPTVLEDWIKQAEAFVALTESARGRDLNVKFMRNPVVPLFGMNLADCILLVTAHTERHVAQIEERLAGSC